jgi:hypothetical protein
VLDVIGFILLCEHLPRQNRKRPSIR